MRDELETPKGSLFLQIITTVLGIIIVLAVLFLFVYFGCEIKNVNIRGNELHDDQVIKDVILNDEYSWNSVYVFLKYKFQKAESIPFIDSMEISLNSPTELTIRVYEKDLIGYVYVDTTGQFAYIDKDGLVEEMSTRVIDDLAMIKGVNVSEVQLYEPLKTDNKGLFKKMLQLTHALEKYRLMPEIIEIGQGGQFQLSYGEITVNFGKVTDLNEKVARMEKILPELEGLTGTLHMEEWTNDASDIIFEKTEE